MVSGSSSKTISLKHYLESEVPFNSDLVDVLVTEAQPHSLSEKIPTVATDPPTPQCLVDVDSALSPEMKKLKKEVFEEIPQTPHFAPLNKFTGKVRNGMIIGMDLAFVNFCEEIRKLEQPQSIWGGLDEFMEQVKVFDEMGYDVEKVRERLMTLKKMARHDRVLVEEREKIKAEKEKHEAKILEMQSRIKELEAEVEEYQVVKDKKGSEIGVQKKECLGAVQEFLALAKKGWK